MIPDGNRTAFAEVGMELECLHLKQVVWSRFRIARPNPDTVIEPAGNLQPSEKYVKTSRSRCFYNRDNRGAWTCLRRLRCSCWSAPKVPARYKSNFDGTAQR